MQQIQEQILERNNGALRGLFGATFHSALPRDRQLFEEYAVLIKRPASTGGRVASSCRTRCSRAAGIWDGVSARGRVSRPRPVLIRGCTQKRGNRAPRYLGGPFSGHRERLDRFPAAVLRGVPLRILVYASRATECWESRRKSYPWDYSTAITGIIGTSVSRVLPATMLSSNSFSSITFIDCISSRFSSIKFIFRDNTSAD